MDSRLRVLRVIARMNTGGPARQVSALANHLDADRFEQHLLIGAVGLGEVDDLALRRVEVEHRRVQGLGRAPSPWDDARALGDLVRELRSFRPHIVHTHTAKAGVLGRTATLIAAAGSPRSRPALVHTFHGHLLRGYFSPTLTRAVVAVERNLARVTDRLVAVGEQVRDELLEAGIGQQSQFVVVPPGVDLGPLPEQGEARARLGLPAGVPVVGFVARLTGVKRPDRFAEAALRVAADCPDSHFVVAGDGELGPELRRKMGAIENRVRMLSWSADVEAVYAAADLIVLTSDNEGMPVSLIEAALAGRPAVATRVGSVAEVVEDGVTGLVVDCDSASVAAGIERLLSDPRATRAMGAAAAERATTRFSGQRLSAATAALYEALVLERETSPGRRWARCQTR